MNNNKKYKISKNILDKINDSDTIVEDLFDNNIKVLNENINTRTLIINNIETILHPIIYNKNIVNLTIKKNLYGNKILLGKGEFGEVYNINTKNNNKIIYKIIKSDQENLEDAIIEYKALKFQYLLQLYLKLNNPNKLKYICKLHEFGFINEIHNYLNIYAIMDNCGKELGKYIIELKKNNNLNLEIIINIIIECAKSIKILHDIRYVHLDIKPENFLISVSPNNKINIKIIDFGFTCKTNNVNFFGNPIYMSPEILQINKIKQSNYDKSDIFSLGCIFIIFIIILFKDINENILSELMVCPIYIFKENNNTNKLIKIRTNYDKTLFEKDIDIINRMLERIIISRNHKKKYIHKIILIIKKMINPDITKRYNNILELIDDLEKIFILKNNNLSLIRKILKRLALLK